MSNKEVATKPEFFEALLSKLRPDVHSICYSILRNKSDAEDATQETLFKVWKHWDTFERNSSITTWVTRIAVNTSIMALRRAWRRYEVIFAEMSTTNEDGIIQPFSEDSIPGSEVSIDLKLDRDMLRQRLDERIDRLSPVIRRIIVLHYFGDIRPAEIAAMDGLVRSTVRVRLLRGREELREMLARAKWFAGYRFLIQ